MYDTDENTVKDSVLREIINIASKNKVKKVILFGSRARKDNTYTSDYDIAVSKEGLSSIDKALFCNEVEDINTLIKIDVVFIDENENDEFIKSIIK